MLLETGTVTRNEIRELRNFERSGDPRADELVIPVYYTGSRKGIKNYELIVSSYE